VEFGSDSSGSPAKEIFRRWRESERTINRPPMTLKFLVHQYWEVRELPKEEVDVKDKTVSECLRDDYPQKCSYTDFWLFSSNNHITSCQHCLRSLPWSSSGGRYANISNQEYMRNSPRQESTIGSKIIYLISKLRNNPQCILKKCYNNQKPPNSRHISSILTEFVERCGDTV